MTKPKAVMNWSGGKDSALALNRVLQAGELDVKYLLTSVNNHWQRISMHGVRRSLLQKQAETIGIELIEILLPESPSMEIYESALNKTLDFLIEKGVTHSIFGDIFLEDLRDYRIEQLKRKNLTAVFPIWQIPSQNLINEFLALKFKAVTVCINAKDLSEEFCGRTIDGSFITELPAAVDVCGENGEYHSFVYDAPFFKSPVKFEKGEIVTRQFHSSSLSAEFYYCDLLPIEENSKAN